MIWALLHKCRRACCRAWCRERAWWRSQSGHSLVFCRPSIPGTRRTPTVVVATTLRTAATQAAARTASTSTTRAIQVATARQSRRSTTSTPLELLHWSCTSPRASRLASSSTLHTTDQPLTSCFSGCQIIMLVLLQSFRLVSSFPARVLLIMFLHRFMTVYTRPG